VRFSPKQLQFYNEATAPFNILVGAISSGKSHIAAHKTIERLRNSPPGDILFTGVSRTTIQHNILSLLYPALGFPLPSPKTMQTKLYGHDVYFKGVHDAGAVKDIQGMSLVFALCDEVVNMPQNVWNMLIGRLRIPGAQLIATCNPEGPAHWFKKEIIDQATEKEVKYWTFLMDDNPALTEEYKTRMKKMYTGMWYKRYIEGEWAVAHGLIYDSFDNDNLYEHPFDNANYYIVGVDYGTSNATAAVLCGVRPNRWPQITVEKEYYYDSAKQGRAKTDDELANDIRDFIAYHNVSAVYVDPSALSLKLELQKRNIPVLSAKNDVLPGIKITAKFFAGKNIVIQKGCKTLIEVLHSYCWDPAAADRGEDKPLKKFEHIADALRYAIYSAFPTGEFNHPDELLTIDQIRRQVYSSDDNYVSSMLGIGQGGYF
jgi:PBSX family phage terminase large subunit